jgi:hypothetical protein
MFHRQKRCLVFAALFLLAPDIASASSREKTDIVYMRNGDKITCEIQPLTQGQLNVKPDYTSSSIALDWAKVDHLESKQEFVVTDPTRETLYRCDWSRKGRADVEDRRCVNGDPTVRVRR